MSHTLNPYARRPVVTAAAAPPLLQEKDGSQLTKIGPQSQQRLTLQERKHRMQSNSNRKKRGQQTLFGDKAFEPLEDCEVCRGKQYGRVVHRAHHKLCNNRRGGAKTKSTMIIEQEEKRLKPHFETPLTEVEKCSGQCLTKDAVEAYFKP